MPHGSAGPCRSHSDARTRGRTHHRAGLRGAGVVHGRAPIRERLHVLSDRIARPARGSQPVRRATSGHCSHVVSVPIPVAVGLRAHPVHRGPCGRCGRLVHRVGWRAGRSDHDHRRSRGTADTVAATARHRSAVAGVRRDSSERAGRRAGSASPSVEVSLRLESRPMHGALEGPLAPTSHPPRSISSRSSLRLQ